MSRLVIGITGHRNLLPEDVPKLEKTLDNVFEEIRGQASDKEIWILTELAEGADRLAARAGKRTEFHIVVPLPMEPEEYKLTFSEPDAGVEFDQLIKQADEVFVVDREDPDMDPFVAAGAYILNHCDVLVAMWDGKPYEDAPEKRGGTAHMVEAAMGQAEYEGVVEFGLKVPVRIIHTQRK